MNPLHVDDWKSALMALGIGAGVGVIVTLVMYFLAPVVTSISTKVSG
jgi:hypothetical protein